MLLKQNAAIVYFLSLVGVDHKGNVDSHEHIFDIYTKKYDFMLTDVEVKSAQDLWEFYEAQNKGSEKWNIDIYTLVEYFVQSHPNAHYVLDEVPFLGTDGSKYKMHNFNSCIYTTIIFKVNIMI